MRANRSYQVWVGGSWQASESKQKIRSPFNGEEVSLCDQASAQQMQQALEAAASAFPAFSTISRFSRARLLSKISSEIAVRREDFVTRIIEEAGKPRTLADIEVTRAVGTFAIAAEEAKRFSGGLVPVDVDAGGRAFSEAAWQWRPRGPVLGIAPFNFPLNLVAHKVAPAIAVGAPILLKPPPQAPGASILLAEIFEKTVKEASDSEVIPLSALQVIPTSNEVASMAVSDPRISIFSFTGSHQVGWMLRDKAAQKKVVLELGGDAAVIVHKDADLKRAAARSAFGAFCYAGQVCISVQRIFVHRDVAQNFQGLLIEEAKKLSVGDPQLKETTVGPVIDSASADRIMSWIAEAKKEGANLLFGGERKDNIISPTILSAVKTGCKLSCEEVFGPIVIVESYENFEDAIQKVNASQFGLQAGVFTDSEKLIQQAIAKLDVGGILINEIPTYRGDHLPYGGVKNSGLGREGVSYAMQEFCEQKTVIRWRG